MVVFSAVSGTPAADALARSFHPDAAAPFSVARERVGRGSGSDATNERSRSFEIRLATTTADYSCGAIAVDLVAIRRRGTDTSIDTAVVAAAAAADISSDTAAHDNIVCSAETSRLGVTHRRRRRRPEARGGRWDVFICVSFRFARPVCSV